MPGETKADISGWTVDTLHSFLKALMDERDAQYRQSFSALKEGTAQALVSAKEAVAKAEVAMEKRFESVNEFRAQLGDQQRTFMPRAEVAALVNAINEKSDARFLANSDKISALDQRMNRSEGRGAGLHAGWGYLAGFIGLAATIISIVMVLLK